MLAVGMRQKRKAISPLLSGILFTAIIIFTTTLVFSIIIPKFSNLKESVTIDQSQLTLNTLNDYINTIVTDGKSSQRIVPLTLKAGEIQILSGNTTGTTEMSRNGKILFLIESDTTIITPRTTKKIGDLVYSSNAYATLTQDDNHINLSNSRMNISIRKLGTAAAPVAIDLSTIVENIHLKADSKYLFSGADNLNFEITGLSDPATGYIYANSVGSNLGRAEAIAELGDIDIHFILESGADYLKILVTCSNLSTPPSTVAINLTSASYVTSDIYRGNYIYSISGNYITGIVNKEGMTNAEVSGTKMSASMPFEDNKIYIPFTRSTTENMDQRLTYVNNNDFESRYNPSFGYKIDDKSTVELYITYDNIRINYGSSTPMIKLRPGSYDLLVRYDNVDASYRYVTVSKTS
ncbi:MAG: hypothetical protein KAJ54_02105 [Candidatus Aenigmarchaeota archaeon]|nr:hypothetical protein [Candidatus Aenigmarchaeota archaeon]